MCGRFTLAVPKPGTLRARFPLGESVAIERRWNVAPSDPVLTVVGGDGPPHGELLRWGLVPPWAESPQVGVKTINARAETIAERPTYRDAFARRRCLVIADGFYEWERRPGGRTQPWWVSRADRAPFAFAGVWASWRGQLRSCSIVTTTANAVLAPIHPRMPVILPPEAEEPWLDPDAPAALLHELLAPLPDEAVRRRRVSNVVNDARYDGPECLADPLPELRLF